MQLLCDSLLLQTQNHDFSSLKCMKLQSCPVCVWLIFCNVYLLSQVSDSLSVPCVSDLVLDEDGTGVDTEEFFQTLPENSALMVLEKGQKWTPYPVWQCLTLLSASRGRCWSAPSSLKLYGADWKISFHYKAEVMNIAFLNWWLIQ